MAKAGSGKFIKQATAYTVELEALFSRAIRQAIMAGLAAAVRGTKHDSSNAAAHWMIAGKASRPQSRRFGKLRDLRGTNGRPSTPPVGKRRDSGTNANATLKFVRDKELREVVDKLVSGRDPDTLFYFYNAIESGSYYGQNANIDEAGQMALQEVKRIFDKRVAAGNVRKKFK